MKFKVNDKVRIKVDAILPELEPDTIPTIEKLGPWEIIEVRDENDPGWLKSPSYFHYLIARGTSHEDQWYASEDDLELLWAHPRYDKFLETLESL